MSNLRQSLRPSKKLTAEGDRLFRKVAEDVLHNSRHTFDRLTEAEKETVLQWLGTAIIDGNPQNAISDILWEVDFHRKPVSVETFMTDPYYFGGSCRDLHPKWMEDLKAVLRPNSPVVEWVMCLSGDTLVPLLDGTARTLQELHAQYELDNKSIWVYSCNGETGQVVPGEATKVTKFAKDQLYKVTFEDGTTVRANIDHEFLCRDGVKRKLKDLQVGSRLMPFFTSNRQQKGQRLHSGYEQVYLPGPKKYAYTHRVVGRMLAGGKDPHTWNGDRAVLHHVNFNCKDNKPSNLRWMGWQEHRDLHATVPRSQAWKDKMSEQGRKRIADPNSALRRGHAKFMRSKAGKALAVRNLSVYKPTAEQIAKKAKEALAVRWASPEQRKKAAEKCALRSRGNTWGKASARKDVTVDMLYDMFGKLGSLSRTYKALSISRNAVVRILSESSLTVAQLKSGYRNHVITRIELDAIEHVYCLTVPAHGNFAIVTDAHRRRGVFSGNTGGIGIGKGQPVDASVLTPQGWKRNGDLRVGDTVIGSRGTPTKVTGVFPRGRLPTYRVRFDDGAEAVVDGDHLWNVRSPKQMAKGSPWKTVATADLARNVLNPRGQKRWHIPVISGPVQFEPVRIPLSAYALGALLGDGGLTGGGIRFSSLDAELIEDVCCETGLTWRHVSGPDYQLVAGKRGGSTENKRNHVLDVLRSLGCCVRSHEKRIPELYLRASVRDRIELLRGLMDTDGWVQNFGKATLISTSSPGLADDIVALVRSLGGIAYRTKKPTTHRDAHVLYLVLPFNPFRLHRKSAQWRPAKKYTARRMIASIEPASSAEIVCIQVDAPDQLYVIKDFVVTHNTTIAVAALGYKAYWLSCMKNPPSYYGLLPDSMLVFGIYSITKKQVNDSGYYKMRGFFDSSPYFRKDFPRNTKLESKIDFKKQNFSIIAGSTNLHAIGLDLYAFCFSANHFVWTEDGPVPIASLINNPKRVWTWDGLQFYLTEPVPAHLTGSKPIWTVYLSNGQVLEPTATQPLRVLRGSHEVWVTTEELCVGDVVIVYPLGRGELHADVRDLQEKSILCEPACEKCPQYDECGISRTVPDCTFMRPCNVSAADQPNVHPLPDMCPALPIPNTQAHKATRVDGCGVYEPVSEFCTEDKDSSRKVVSEVQGQCFTTTETTGVHSFFTQRYGEDARAVQERHRMAKEGGYKDNKSIEEGSVVGAVLLQGARIQEQRGGCHSSDAGLVENTVGVRAGVADTVHRPQGDSAPLHAGFSDRREVSRVSSCISAGREFETEDSRVRCRTVVRERVENLGGSNGIPPPSVLPAAAQNQDLRHEISSRLRDQNKSDTYITTTRVVRIVKGYIEQPTYDILNVPKTHAFVTGTRLDCSPAVVKNCMDEVNFMRSKMDAETGKMAGQAYELYNSTNKRLVSRFLREGGTIPGLMILLSSRSTQTSFLEERLRVTTGKRSTYVSDYSLWDVKSPEKFYGPWFSVEVGDRVSRSRILRSALHPIIEQQGRDEISAKQAMEIASKTDCSGDEQPRPGARVVKIPGVLYTHFCEDVDQSLRDYAGVATFNMSPLIQDRQSVFDAFKPGLQNPFKTDNIIIDLTDPTTLDEYLDLRKICRVQNGKWVPRYHPDAPRFIHCDTGVTGDAFGFGVSHLAGMRRIVRKNVLDGTEMALVSPYAQVDMLAAIRPLPGGEIDLEKIQGFILYLKQFFVIGGVSYDGYQSTSALQSLRKLGMDATVISVDKTDDQYLHLRSFFSERRIAMYHYNIVENELLDLQRNSKTRKVDHPAKSTAGGVGTKDVADGLCGSIWNASTSPVSLLVARNVEFTDETVSAFSTPPVDTKQPEAVLAQPKVTTLPTVPSTVPAAPRQAVRKVTGISAWEDLRKNI